MAVINKPNEENVQQPQGTTAPAQVGGPQMLSGQTASISSAGPSQQAGSGQVGSGRFTNLQRYINANKGSGERLAGRIGQDVDKSAQNVEKSAQEVNNVQSQLDAEKQRIAQASGFAQQIQQDPTQIANDQNKLQTFASLRTGDQTNINNINNAAQQNIAQAQANLGTLQQNASNVATEKGRFALLQQALGRPTYNRGQQRLDQLMVQNSGGGVLNNLQRTAAQTAQNATKTIDTVNNNLSTGLNDARSALTEAQKTLVDSLGGLDDATTDANEAKGAFGSLQNALRERQQQFIQQNEGLKTQLDTGVKEDRFSPEVLQMLGLQAGQALYDVNLDEYINPNWSSGNVNEQSVATEADLARYNALAALSGTNPMYLSQQQIGTAKGLELPQDQLQALKDTINSRHNTFTNLQNSYNNDLRNSQWAQETALARAATQAANPYEAAQAVNNLYSQYGDSLAQGRTDSLNSYHRSLIDWAKNYTALNPNRALQDASAGKGITVPQNYLGTQKT